MSPTGHDPGAAPLLVVVGPTAAGKSTVAEHLTVSLSGELVSADALQVYRGLDIGTAKPTVASRQRCAYHCIDYLEPLQRCSAGAYAAVAWQAIDRIRSRRRQPILVGGSGFYVQAVVDGLDEAPPSDPRWHQVLGRLVGRHGVESLYKALQRLDPQWAGRIGDRDAQRICRALEVILRTGHRMSDLAGSDAVRSAPDAAWLGVTWPRALLYQRIELRVDQMLASGWIDEVEGLLAAGVPRSAHALQAIGYRQLAGVCRGELELEVAREEIIRSTRRYAKRQLAWFKRWPQVSWLEYQAGDEPGGGAQLERADRLASALLSAGGRGTGSDDVAAPEGGSHNGGNERT